MPKNSNPIVSSHGPPRAGTEVPSVRFSARQLVSGPRLILFALGAGWLLFFNALRGEWDVNPQYSFGYVVPFLGAALFWRRWADRPATAPGSSAILGWVVAGLLFLQLPLSLVLVANPEWRLLYWVNGVQVLGLTVCWLFRCAANPKRFVPRYAKALRLPLVLWRYRARLPEFAD